MAGLMILWMAMPRESSKCLKWRPAHAIFLLQLDLLLLSVELPCRRPDLSRVISVIILLEDVQLCYTCSTMTEALVIDIYAPLTLPRRSLT